MAATAVTDAKAFSATEALDGKLVDIIASSPNDLLSKLNGRTITRFDGSTVQLALSHPVLQPVEMTGREKFLSRIVEPDVFFILLIVGALGLYTEFTHPGVFAPGVIGAIALLLALFAMHMLPVNLTGLLLIGLALGLFILEAKFPTHGVLGVGGVASMVLGALLLVRSPLTGMGVSFAAALAVALPFGLIVIILMRAVLRSRGWKQAAGKEELIGEEGEVVEPVGGTEPSAGAGLVRVHGELWRAATPAGENIPKGARVRVRKVDGLTIQVEMVGAAAVGVFVGGVSEEAAMNLDFPEVLMLGVVVIFLFWIFNSIYVIKEWERGVVLRLGRMLPNAKGAGLQLVLYPIDKLTRISLRIETLDVPPQDVITRDNVSVKVNAVCYFRVVDANLALSQVQNYLYATSQLAQTTLRSLVGQFELDAILSEREKVNAKLQQILDQDTESWGIKVTKVEVKQVDIPENMQRAIAKQAEAERERRAKIIHAEGEFEASQKLADAAEVLEKQPAAIQLRYLQTLTEIGVEKNTTIVFPLPVDIISQWVKAFAEKK